MQKQTRQPLATTQQLQTKDLKAVLSLNTFKKTNKRTVTHSNILTKTEITTYIPNHKF